MESLLPPFSIGRRVFLMRKFAGLNQIELAKAMGVSQGYISKIEQDKLVLSAVELIRLKEFFQISADAILDGGIIYQEVSRLFQVEVPIPSLYRHEKTTKMAFFYPFLKFIEKQKDSTFLSKTLKDLGFQKMLLADPTLEVSLLFLFDLLSSAKKEGLSLSQHDYEVIFRDLFFPASLVKENIDDKEDWLQKFCALMTSFTGQLHYEAKSFENQSFKVMVNEGKELQSPFYQDISPVFHSALLNGFFKRFDLGLPSMKRVEDAELKGERDFAYLIQWA